MVEFRELDILSPKLDCLKVTLSILQKHPFKMYSNRTDSIRVPRLLLDDIECIVEFLNGKRTARSNIVQDSREGLDKLVI